MTRTHHNKPSARLLRSLYMWHRWLGLAAALFVLILSVTGLLLNHTEGLRLDSRHMQSPALLFWYGIKAPENSISFLAGKHTVSAADDTLLLNQTIIPDISGTPVGAAYSNQMVVVAYPATLVLLTDSGELVEKIDSSSGLPAGIRAIGQDSAGTILLRTDQQLFAGNRDLTQWHAVTSTGTSWSEPVTLQATARTQLANAWRGNGLSLERVLLDVHSGRILGRYGVYVMDSAAILFCLLALSGVWLWGRRRASARTHRRRLQEHRNSE